MNLAKLLVAGKSIINGRAAVAYRPNKHVYVPKFGNPFQLHADGEPVGVDPDAGGVPVKQVATPVAAKTQKLPPWPPGPTRTTSWASKLNPISRWREAHALEITPTPVQSELSLDTVKVVHNDLSDADVEVVPMKSRSVDPSTIPDLPPPTRSWEFLAERMFHVKTD